MAFPILVLFTRTVRSTINMNATISTRILVKEKTTFRPGKLEAFRDQ